MSENSKIDWCDHTFNPFIGCTKVSPGCDNCYTESFMDTRIHRVVWGPHGTRVLTSAANWRKPRKWNAAHAAFSAIHGRRQRVFSASHADVFDNAVNPLWRSALLDLIVDTPNLDWLLLTKRIGNAADMLEQAMAACSLGRRNWRDNPLQNVWLGATVVNQEEAGWDIPKLLTTPASVRFLSLEPLLGPVDLTAVSYTASPGYFGDALQWHHQPHSSRQERYPAVHWVIVSGESGPRARPMQPAWARGLRDQCASAGVPFLFKQWGAWTPRDPLDWDGRAARLVLHKDGRAYLREGRNLPDAIIDTSVRRSAEMHRLGKKATGRLLDGALHDEFPEPVR